MTQQNVFSGSYNRGDVQFLLKPITLENTTIAAKEALIQSGKKHYSELLTHELLPANDYLALFYQAMMNNQDRLARHLIILAKNILATRQQSITLVSLARAGTPIGVLLKQILLRYFNTEVSHYSVSIIRDVGLDQNALRFILQRHSPESLVFVDGWTGKGVIARQLAASLQAFSISDGVVIPAELYVLADLSGYAAVAASSEDYLIPSCVLNSTVSGLVSRSIYNTRYLNADDFHGCVYYDDFEQHDLSQYFVQAIMSRVACLWQICQSQQIALVDRQQLQTTSDHFLLRISQEYNVSDYTYIKPGIGEATRVLLRREAQLLLIQAPDSDATQHLRWLAEQRAIPVVVFYDLPYQAVAIIKQFQS